MSITLIFMFSVLFIWFCMSGLSGAGSSGYCSGAFRVVSGP